LGVLHTDYFGLVKPLIEQVLDGFELSLLLVHVVPSTPLVEHTLHYFRPELILLILSP
jgi:hypothetical protein